MRFISTILMQLVFAGIIQAQTVVPLWSDYVKDKKEGKVPFLPDFSFAGYHFSEKAIPDVSKRKYFNVVDFGAKPNDDISDEVGIQKAINAAEENPGGGVVFFPKGKFIINGDTLKRYQIRVTKSNIVLKGSGAGIGGTEIHQPKMWVNNRSILFKSETNRSDKLATITKDAPRETFVVEVDNASKLKPGQDVIVRHRSEEYTRKYFAPQDLKPQWTRLFGPNGGMQIIEIHTIKNVNGNKVTFHNPLHLDITLVKSAPFELYNYSALEECGVEDILFSSDWKSYPEEFVHHKNAIHDNAYLAIGMENVKNSWVRNCEFRDWNDCLFFRAGYAVTVENVKFTGKKGHTSLHARSGNGVLVKKCSFNGAQHHGPGTGYGAAGTVVTQCQMDRDQHFDSHGGQPYATLLDDIDGGIFTNLGGPEAGHPHHGQFMVFWNFIHKSSKDFHYNFWDMQRRRNYTMAHPILVGFQADTKVTFENEGMNVLFNKVVKPQSLFEAQLALRLTGKDIAK